MKKRQLIPMLITLMLSNAFGWGWGSHRYINDAAVDHLPQELSFFQDHRDYLSEHAVDPDTDDFPGYYHYIDIDYYPEFFAGTLPHTWQAMIDLYGQDIMEDNGVIPWVIEWWLADLSTLMAAGDWDNVWQIAAELGHYVADSHQALHLTLNYNGQLTNNYGIHSRYETQMINPHLDELTAPDSAAGYWDSPIDSVFKYIDETFPIVDLIMIADDRAYAVDSNHGSTYYDMMWEDLADTTIWTMEQAAVHLASVWYTAWINAGSPYPPGLSVDPIQTPDNLRIVAFPNPFNASTTFQFHLEHSDMVELNIIDLNGRLIKELGSKSFPPGAHVIHWDGSNQHGQAVDSGIYFVELNQSGMRSVNKLTLLK